MAGVARSQPGSACLLMKAAPGFQALHPGRRRHHPRLPDLLRQHPRPDESGPGRLVLEMKWILLTKSAAHFPPAAARSAARNNVVMSLLMLMLSNRMIVAGPCTANEKTGSVWGEIRVSAMTGALDPGVSQGELDSARRLGERVAKRRRSSNPRPSAIESRFGEARFRRPIAVCPVEGQKTVGLIEGAPPPNRVFRSRAWRDLSDAALCCEANDKI